MSNHSFILSVVLLSALCAHGEYIDRPAASHAAQLRRHTGIPSLAVSPVNGRLWVTFYGGITPGEDSNNYLVLATSGDGGRSWKQVLAADPDGAGPHRVFDSELWVAPDGKLRWTFTDRLAKLAPPPEQYVKAYAGDEGDPKTDQLMCVVLDAEREPEAPFPQPRAIAQGVMMCKPTVLRDGTWLMPVSHWGAAPSACFYASADGGKTFSLRGGATLPKELRLYDEHVVTELRNGDLLTFMRAGWKKPFQESVSHDGGRTWETPRAARFAHTSSRLFLRRLASGNLLLVKNGPFDKDVGRSRLTAFLSEDDGTTWSGGFLLDEREGVSYPDGDQAKDGTIYVVYDRDRLGAQEILFAAFTEADVKAGRAVDARTRLRQIVERKPPSGAARRADGEVRVAKTIRPPKTEFCFNPDFHTYQPFNDDYAVRLGGRDVEVRACRESRIPFNRVWPGRQRPLDQTERASYIALEADGPVKCEVKPKHAFKRAVVRPLSAGVKPSVDGGAISFTLPKPGFYVLETDGQSKALHMFMERPRDFAEKKDATRYYGPGMHVAGFVRLKDHDRVYVDRDAIVFGCFTGDGVKDVKVFGHGVIDGRACERIFEGCYSPLQFSCLRFHGSKDVVVDGPILMDSPNWVLACFDCEDVDIRHVKIVGQWRYNTDGIDICNSRRVGVRDCFVRSFDDTIVIKGVWPYAAKAVEDVTVERCVLWCGWGKTIEPGIETWAPHFRNVRFSDCDILRSDGAALNISAGGPAPMEDFTFDDIRVEMQTDNLPAIYQKTDEMRYEPGTRKANPLLVKVDNRQWLKRENEPLGHVKNCTFRNIAVLAEPGVPPPGILVRSATPPSGAARPHENVTLEGFTINGKAVEWSSFNFITNTPVILK